MIFDILMGKGKWSNIMIHYFLYILLLNLMYIFSILEILPHKNSQKNSR